jgi:hypothetical protein
MTVRLQLSQILAGLILLVVPVVMVGCQESPSDSVPQDSASEQPGFAGKVSGALSGEISGPGVATYIPSQETVTGSRAGYYLIANTRSVKDVLVTFRIPADTEPGTYRLHPRDPMELGENFEVQVDSRIDGLPVSYGFKTEGTVTLETFPADGSKLSGAKVKGSFDFVTEDDEGGSVSAEGTFEFMG